GVWRRGVSRHRAGPGPAQRRWGRPAETRLRPRRRRPAAIGRERAGQRALAGGVGPPIVAGRPGATAPPRAGALALIRYRSNTTTQSRNRAVPILWVARRYGRRGSGGRFTGRSGRWAAAERCHTRC